MSRGFRISEWERYQNGYLLRVEFHQDNEIDALVYPNDDGTYRVQIFRVENGFLEDLGGGFQTAEEAQKVAEVELRLSGYEL